MGNFNTQGGEKLAGGMKTSKTYFQNKYCAIQRIKKCDFKR